MHKNASITEIKKSYRALAHVYHPDKNQGNDIVSAYFTEVHEAYAVLSNPISKRVYDRERSRLRHASEGIPSIEVSASSILKELDQLAFITQTPTTGQINKELALAYLKFLFTKQNIAILIAENKHADLEEIIDQTISISHIFDYYYFKELSPFLILLANKNEKSLERIHNLKKEKQRKAIWIKLFPFFISLITVIICIMMYFYAQN